MFSKEYREINLLYDYGINAFKLKDCFCPVYKSLACEPEMQGIPELELLNQNSISRYDFLRVIATINRYGEKRGFGIVFL